MTRQQLIIVLSHIQNHPQNAHTDILTFSSFMADGEELIGYVLGHFQRLDEAGRRGALEVARRVAA